eukprot:scaffold71201_cov66-Attheya_sp.AAC.2
MASDAEWRYARRYMLDTWAAAQASNFEKIGICHACRSPGSDLKTCAGCYKTIYCSCQCQKADWESGGHKQKCPTLLAGRHLVWKHSHAAIAQDTAKAAEASLQAALTHAAKAKETADAAEASAKVALARAVAANDAAAYAASVVEIPQLLGHPTREELGDLREAGVTQDFWEDVGGDPNLWGREG